MVPQILIAVILVFVGFIIIVNGWNGVKNREISWRGKNYPRIGHATGKLAVLYGILRLIGGIVLLLLSLYIVKLLILG